MDKKLYRVFRPIASNLFKFFYRPTYLGKENLELPAFVLAGNHTSLLDCLLLMASTKRTIHFLAKDSLVKGLKKHLFLNLGIIPVNRSIHDKKALNMAIEELKNNHVVGVFPEATINRTTNKTLPFKIGAVKMAYDTNSYLVPFVIRGKYKLFSKSITLEFFKPYKVTSNLSLENANLRSFIGEKI